MKPDSVENDPDFPGDPADQGDVAKMGNPVDALESGDLENSNTENNNAKIHSIWLAPLTMKKIAVLKRDMGVTWTQFMETVCGHILASGGVSNEARQKLRDLGSPSVDQAIGDRYWRGAFGTDDPWPDAAASQAKIIDELAKTHATVTNLAQAVDDHSAILRRMTSWQPRRGRQKKSPATSSNPAFKEEGVGEPVTEPAKCPGIVM